MEPPLAYDRFNLAHLFPLYTHQKQKPLAEDVEIVISLVRDLRSVVNFSATDIGGLSLVHKAAALGLTALAQVLIEIGSGDHWILDAMVIFDGAGRTPLHWAVSASHPWDIAEPLVRCLAAAQPDVLSPSWNPPIKPPPDYKTLRSRIPMKNTKLLDLIGKVRAGISPSALISVTDSSICSYIRSSTCQKRSKRMPKERDRRRRRSLLRLLMERLLPLRQMTSMDLLSQLLLPLMSPPHPPLPLLWFWLTLSIAWSLNQLSR